MKRFNIRVEDNDNISQLIFKILLFIFYPLGAVFYSLKNINSKSSYLIFFFFGLLFCWNMTPRDWVNTDDFHAIILRFQESHFTWEDIVLQVKYILTFNEKALKDVYENILIWLVKCYTENYHWYFLSASIPYLFFNLNVVRDVTNDQKFKVSFYGLLIIFLLILPRDLITIQNPRFTTATWIAIFSTIKFWMSSTGRSKYLILILITPLIHSAFWFYVICMSLILTIHFFRPSQRILLILVYISIAFSYLSYDLLLYGIDFIELPYQLQNWVERYSSEDSYNRRILHSGASGYFWVTQLFNFLKNTSYQLIPIFLWRERANINKYVNLKRFFEFYLLFIVIVNFIQFVPVLGQRFFWLSRIFSIYIWFKVIYPRYNSYLLLILICCSWDIFMRYFYFGALYKCVPYDIFYMPLPSILLG